MARDGCVDTETALLDFCLQLRRESTFNPEELLAALAFCAGNTISRDYANCKGDVLVAFSRLTQDAVSVTDARIKGIMAPIRG
ncbi:hypothetical protein DFQ01_103191 [Paenibacillus cellulosilyticus]|uniref:Uncharacterized protein n=1 Tax=Paenibacillus cellulosilyticus TaxID=375489 RepID=A0A2V2Z118_9BACL|nr:hypothetical protein DFQ01_103191 [Paenibacillus cellulosilyticus]